MPAPTPGSFPAPSCSVAGRQPLTRTSLLRREGWAVSRVMIQGWKHRRVLVLERRAGAARLAPGQLVDLVLRQSP